MAPAVTCSQERGAMGLRGVLGCWERMLSHSCHHLGCADVPPHGCQLLHAHGGTQYAAAQPRIVGCGLHTRV